MAAVKGIGAAAGLPELFAVVDVDHLRVVARGLSRAQATGFAQGWTRDNGPAECVAERVTWPTDDQVLEQLQLAQ
jgi:hypothetical protein